MITAPERLARRVLNAQGLKSRWLMTSVGRIHALDGVGQGPLPPIVMLHGFSANAISYSGLLRRFVPHTRRVIAPDMPGHGLSDVPAAGLGREAMLAGLHETLDRLIDEPAIVIGNSMGGLGAIRYAISRPQKVRGLVLISPGGAPMPEGELQTFLNTFRIERYTEALNFVDRMFAHSPRVLRHALAMGIRGRFAHPEMRRLIDDIRPEDLLTSDDLRALKMPGLFIWGREEWILPRCQFEFFHEHLPAHIELEEWANFGHCGFMEQPEALTRRMVRFIRGAFRDGPSLRVSTNMRERAKLRASA